MGDKDPVDMLLCQSTCQPVALFIMTPAVGANFTFFAVIGFDIFKNDPKGQEFLRILFNLSKH